MALWRGLIFLCYKRKVLKRLVGDWRKDWLEEDWWKIGWRLMKRLVGDWWKDWLEIDERLVGDWRKDWLEIEEKIGWERLMKDWLEIDERLVEKDWWKIGWRLMKDWMKIEKKIGWRLKKRLVIPQFLKLKRRVVNLRVLKLRLQRLLKSPLLQVANAIAHLYNLKRRQKLLWEL